MLTRPTPQAKGCKTGRMDWIWECPTRTVHRGFTTVQRRMQSGVHSPPPHGLHVRPMVRGCLWNARAEMDQTAFELKRINPPPIKSPETADPKGGFSQTPKTVACGQRNPKRIIGGRFAPPYKYIVEYMQQKQQQHLQKQLHCQC